MKDLKIPRIRSTRGSCNITPSNAVDDAITTDIFINICIVLVRNGGVVLVLRMIESGVR